MGRYRTGRVEEMIGEESDIGDKESFIMLGLIVLWCWLAYRALLAQISIGLDRLAYSELGWVGLVLLAMLIISYFFRISSSKK